MILDIDPPAKLITQIEINSKEDINNKTGFWPHCGSYRETI